MITSRLRRNVDLAGTSYTGIFTTTFIPIFSKNGQIEEIFNHFYVRIGLSQQLSSAQRPERADESYWPRAYYSIEYLEQLSFKYFTKMSKLKKKIKQMTTGRQRPVLAWNCLRRRNPFVNDRFERESVSLGKEYHPNIRYWCIWRYISLFDG